VDRAVPGRPTSRRSRRPASRWLTWCWPAWP